MKTNRKTSTAPVLTHGPGPAAHISALQELRRSVMACLLWESTFYESGEDIATRIASLVDRLKLSRKGLIEAGNIAIEARTQMHLRHVPLLLCRELARVHWLKSETLDRCILRADEIAEFVALYWRDGRRPLPAQVKLGLAAAFQKFDAYQFGKYNPKDAAVRLRDVMFLVHPKPVRGQKAAFKAIADDTLKAPDTWEVQLSAGKDKAKTFMRLIRAEKLGGMALLRNLRGMIEAGVPKPFIRKAIEEANFARVLPFRFISAARHAPDLEPTIEAALFTTVGAMPWDRLPGRTIVLVDVSGSMTHPLSAGSNVTRMDAACGLAIIAREMGDDVSVFTFSTDWIGVPPRRGFALRDAIVASQPHDSTDLDRAVRQINVEPGAANTRLIVITDEQAQGPVSKPVSKRAYMINVASYKSGVGYGAWTHIDGFSESTLRYISEVEREVE